MILSVVSRLLEMRGYTPICVASGVQAVELTAASPPDLIQLDIRMPGLTRRGVVGELRARGGHVPIVVMSAAAEIEQFSEEIDADGYLAKPFPLSDLLAHVVRRGPGRQRPSVASPTGGRRSAKRPCG
jgi:CheY-like chemotaxis protein